MTIRERLGLVKTVTIVKEVPVESQKTLMWSSETSKQSGHGLRELWAKAKFIEDAVVPFTLAQRVAMVPAGAKVPDDYNDYADYKEAYEHEPIVYRSIELKHNMIWQNGFDLVAATDAQKKTANDFLQSYEVDVTLKDGSKWALVYGNMYWLVRDGQYVPLDPARMGIVPDAADKTKIGKYAYGAERYTVEEIVHLRFNVSPFAFFGTGCIRNVLPTLKAIVLIETKLPALARRLSHPTLKIDWKPTMTKDEFDRNKAIVDTLPEGENMHNNGNIVAVDEIFKNVGNSRQMIEPILDHFSRKLVAGLGVNDIVLGYGGTTTMATAEYQERILEPEVRVYQRDLKAFIERELFPVAKITGVTVSWKPLRELDKDALSARLINEVRFLGLSPKTALKQLGYADTDYVEPAVEPAVEPPADDSTADVEPEESRD